MLFIYGDEQINLLKWPTAPRGRPKRLNQTLARTRGGNSATSQPIIHRTVPRIQPVPIRWRGNSVADPAEESTSVLVLDQGAMLPLDLGH